MNWNYCKASRWAFVLVAALATQEAAWSATVRKLELTEVRDRAESIFAGTVTGITQRVGDTGKMVWTDYAIEVDDLLKGPARGASTTLSFAGGTVGDLSIGVSDVPHLSVGDRCVFFVASGEHLAAPTVGWGQGLYRIQEARTEDTSRQLLISFDGEPLQLAEDGRLLRGPTIQIEGGEIVETAHLTAEARRQRVSEPVWTGASGEVALQPAPLAAQAPPARRFASYDDLKLFISGALGAVPTRADHR